MSHWPIEKGEYDVKDILVYWKCEYLGHVALNA